MLTWLAKLNDLHRHHPIVVRLRTRVWRSLAHLPSGPLDFQLVDHPVQHRNVRQPSSGCVGRGAQPQLPQDIRLDRLQPIAALEVTTRAFRTVQGRRRVIVQGTLYRHRRGDRLATPQSNPQRDEVRPVVDAVVDSVALAVTPGGTQEGGE